MAPEPAYWFAPEWDYTLGHQVAEVAALAGFVPDEAQARILDAIFAERRGLPAAFEALLVGCRQNFKSGVLEQTFLGWMFVTGEPGATWTAHVHDTARGSFEHLAGLIEATPSLSRHVETILEGKHDERIVLRGDRVFQFGTRTGRAGRGRSFGKHVWDEYLYVTSTHEGTLMPTMSTFPDAQRIGASTAGIQSSDRARSLRDRGRRGDRTKDPRLLYVEFADDLPGDCERGVDCTHLYGTPGCKYDDEDRWFRANPALGVRITLDYVRNERRALSPDEFGRERLGYWDDPAETVAHAIASADWQALADPASEVAGEPVFALDVSPDRAWSTIVAAGRTLDDRVHVEVTSRDGVVDHRSGTAWVVKRFKKLIKAYPGLRVHLLGRSQAETFSQRLDEMGCFVEVVQSGDWPQACTAFLDMVENDRVVHIGQVELNAAVDAAVLVPVGEEQAKYGRRKSAGQIGPLVAATLAAVGLDSESSVYDERGLVVL